MRRFFDVKLFLIVATAVMMLIVLQTFIFLYSFRLHAQNISLQTAFVDGRLTSDCTLRNYSISQRNCSGIDGNAYQKVNTAIGAITSGDTVLVREGTYAEYRPYTSTTGVAFYINQALTLKAYPHETVILTYDPSSPPHYDSIHYNPIIEIFTPGTVVIDGFVIRGTRALGAVSGHEAEIDINIVTYPGAPTTITIQNNKLVEAGHSGLKFGNLSGPLTVQYNEFADDGFSYLDHGIYSLAGDSNTKTIRYNAFHNIAGYGVHIYSSAGTPAYHEVYGNVIYNNKGGGIVVTGHHQKIYNNTVYSNSAAWGMRLYYYNLQSLEVKNNIFWNNNTDIDCETSGTTKVSGVMSNNVWKTIMSVEGTPGACDVVKNSQHLTTDPQFVAASPQTPPDFRLKDGSPALTLGASLDTAFSFALSPELGAWVPYLRQQAGSWVAGAFTSSNSSRQGTGSDCAGYCETNGAAIPSGCAWKTGTQTCGRQYCVWNCPAPTPTPTSDCPGYCEADGSKIPSGCAWSLGTTKKCANQYCVWGCP